jgi:regulator of protease activity HflC (stomatin/prohibitin superfamily)
MAFKPNYNQQRAERDRAKEQKKQEKLQRRQAESERRKAGLEPEGDAPASDPPSES